MCGTRQEHPRCLPRRMVAASRANHVTATRLTHVCCRKPHLQCTSLKQNMHHVHCRNTHINTITLSHVCNHRLKHLPATRLRFFHAVRTLSTHQHGGCCPGLVTGTYNTLTQAHTNTFGLALMWLLALSPMSLSVLRWTQ